jgi:hypothetical protein
MDVDSLERKLKSISMQRHVKLPKFWTRMCVSTRALWLAGLNFNVFSYVVSYVGINSADRCVEVIKYADYEFVAYLDVLSWH